MIDGMYLVTEENEDRVDKITMLAANHRLTVLHKIGIYGKIKQHELYLSGRRWDYLRFRKELKNLA